MEASSFSNSFKEGFQGESKFVTLAQKKGFLVKKSSDRQDMNEHIDYFLTKNNNTVSFDVKAQKRVARNSRYKTDDKIWIELKNVNGKNGWLYGKQDCIAFETSDSFIVVRRDQLAAHISHIIDFSKPYVHSAKEAHYRLYQRKGRKDCITTISKNELFKLNYRIWQK